MKSLTLFLPDSTYEALNNSAQNTGIELVHYCSNLLVDIAVGGKVVGQQNNQSNGKPILRAKKLDDLKPDKTIPQIQLIKEIISFLRENGGKAEKVIVEEAIFEKYKTEFL